MDAKAAALFTDEAVGELEVVACFNGPMPTGVTVSARGRIFINYPKSGDDVPFTVAEVRGGQAHPCPDQPFNNPEPDNPGPALGPVQSVVVDPADRLWILDT